MRRVTVDRLGFAVLLVLAFLVALRPALDNDTWWHLRTGELILDSGIPHVEPFSHTRPLVDRVATDWGSQILFRALWGLGGGPLLAIVVALLATVGIAVLYTATRGPVLVRTGACLLAALAASYFWAARPQMFTFVASAVVVAVVRRWRDRPRPALLWWLVPVFVLWANLHGAVAYGFLVLGGTLAGEVGNLAVHRWHPLGVEGVTPKAGRDLAWLAGVSAVCAAVIVANPSGVRIYGLALHQTGASVRYVQEYQPPSLADPATWPFFVLLAGTVLAMALRWRRLDLVDVLLVGGVGLFSLRVGRVISFFAEVAAPVLSRDVAAVLEQRGRWDPDRRPQPVPVGMVVLTALGCVLVTVLAVGRRLDADTVAAAERAAYPVEATDWLVQQQPPARLFNTFDWGGYLIWRARGYRVAIDGRTDVYDEYLDTYAAVITAQPGWEDELRREDVNTVIVDTGAPLAAALARTEGWRIGHRDDVATVFVREAPVPITDPLPGE